MPHFEVGLETEVPLDLFLDAGNVLGLGQFEDGLGVVGHGAVAVHGDVDRAHAQEAERHQAEREDRADADQRPARHELHAHDVVKPLQADEEGHGHEARDEDALPEGAEVAGHQPDRIVSEAPPSREAVTISWTCLEWRAGEDLGELGNEHGRQGAATDDRRQLPPEIGGIGLVHR